MLDVIESTGLALHDMHKYRTIIHCNPLRILLARYRQRVHMGCSANEIIHLIVNSCHLGITLSLSDNHHLLLRFFDLTQINGYNTLSLTISDAFNNRFQQFLSRYFFHINKLCVYVYMMRVYKIRCKDTIKFAYTQENTK